jgi:NadR type nicotinamide-nucleotide adenylyltransferase
MSLGVVIGKFLPFHRGHALLLQAAAERCDETVAIVCDAAWHGLDPHQRASWIEESFPAVRPMVLDQDALGLPDDDSEGWARATVGALGRAPDVVFTSEDYGPRYASVMGAAHVMVDRERAAVPIRASAVRAAPLAHLDFLPPHVRAHYVPRVCVLGAESTGKTTLAEDLGRHYGVKPVPEFGRFYTEAMPQPTRYRWAPLDFQLIASVQARFEDDAARWTDPPLVCDTNPYVTAVFHEAYLGRQDPEMIATAAARRYDLFVLCDPDTPFEPDATGLREDGERRLWMHRRFCEYADSQPTPVLRVRGTPEERLRQGIRAIDEILRAGREARPSPAERVHGP